MSIVHLITRSNRCKQLSTCRSYMHRGQSIIATLYNPRAAGSVRYERSRGVFNCICSRRDGPYGKVGELNVRSEPRHELGQTWDEPWTGGINVDGGFVGGARGIAMCDVLQNPFDSIRSERQKLSMLLSYPPAIYAARARAESYLQSVNRLSFSPRMHIDRRWLPYVRTYVNSPAFNARPRVYLRARLRELIWAPITNVSKILVN